MVAAVALLTVSGSALAQTTTSTDAAIVELRQLLADQRAALDRQAQVIEDQGRRLEFLAGTRVNKDGQRATSSQIQSGWTLKF